ncbi:hypothetical protein HS088_TW10G00011 [Tripterygium wilfordii]|uniref:Small multi-drug export protein n=1 Tax=Tripterygium wilfordii TaxID=458696 RepID=A0A7J7D4N0_TRIWF|nr:uncharacterized protein LOC120007764 [Tripterygium wilfordii]KAF5741016.1 hypothetical protein HS088_TW10G00011 [Tripterygium wilfordii]
MAASVTPLSFSFSFPKSHLKIIPFLGHPSIVHDRVIATTLVKSRPSLAFQNSHFSIVNFRDSPRVFSSASSSSLERYLDSVEDDEIVPFIKEKPIKYLLCVVFWATFSIAWFVASGNANAVVDSIKASSFGVKVASALRGSGWPDEAVVFALATLPVIELRGAIPVGYWMELKPVLLTVLSVLGNMVPVPFIILYLKKVASSLVGKNKYASQVLDMLFRRAKEKAGPVEEFQWLGLMLFVAVPFPGTGAWTGAIIASVLDMPFWPAFSANFFGVVLAGLLVNLLVNLGLKYAIVTGVLLFFISTFMWSILRNISRSLNSSK